MLLICFKISVMISGLLVSFSFNVIGNFGINNGIDLSRIFNLMLINIGSICICWSFCCVLLIILVIVLIEVGCFIRLRMLLNCRLVLLLVISLMFVWLRWEIIML